MTLFFPQWQGTDNQQVHLGAERLASYYADRITNRIILEKHTMQTSKKIKHFSAIHNHALRCRELLKKHRPKTIFTIGGDASTSFIPISFLAQKYQDFGLLWIGSLPTPDLNIFNPYFNQLILPTILGKGDTMLSNLAFDFLKPEQIFQTGDDYKNMKNIKIQEALAQNRIKHLYIHLNIKKDFQLAEIEKIASLIQSLKDNFKLVGTAISESQITRFQDLKRIESILEKL